MTAMSQTGLTLIKSLQTSLGGGGNRNLLHNWYFQNPVNQKGTTETASITTQNFIDRWTSAGMVKINDDCITLSAGDSYINAYPCLSQGIYNYKNLLGKQVTFSVLYRKTNSEQISISLKNQDSGSGFIYTFTYDQSIGSDWNLISCTGIVPEHSTHIIAYIYLIKPPTANLSIDVLAAKLELGPVQTLAHKEGNKWVLNEIPDYAEQYSICRWFNLNTATTLVPKNEIQLSNSNGTFSKAVVSFGNSGETNINSDHNINLFLGTNRRLQIFNGGITLNKGSDWHQFQSFNSNNQAFIIHHGYPNSNRNEVQFAIYKNSNDITDNNRNLLLFRIMNDATDITNSTLLISNTTNGTTKTYNIYGQHNIVPSLNDVTINSNLETGKIILVYSNS